MLRLSSSVGAAVVAAVVALGVPASSVAADTTTTFVAVADAYVSQSKPSTKFGQSTELRVARPLAEQRSYLRFDVRGLTGLITSATLRLSPNTSSTAYNVHRVTSTTWAEKSITWSNAPPITATVLGASSLATDGWTQADVTAVVSANGLISFGLDTTSVSAVSLASREIAARAPRLVVVTSPAADTTAPVVSLTQPADGGTLSTATPTFGGAAGVATGDLSTVTVNVYSGTSVSSAAVRTLSATRSGGSWSVVGGSALADGTYTARAEQSDDAGNVGFSAPSTFVVDTVAPAVSLTQPVDGSTLSSATPTFGGGAGVATGDSGVVSVKVYGGSSASGTALQTLSATRSGSVWSVPGESALADGTYTARAQQSDAVGNVGLSASSTFQVTTPVVDYSAEVTADAPRAYWRLGESSGLTAVSVTGTDAATYLNGVLLGQPGALTGDANTAVGLDGADDNIRAAHSANLSPTAALSVEAWIRPGALPTTTATIVRKDLQYLLRLTSAGAVTLRLWKAGAISEINTPSGTVRAGVWNHVVGTWNGTTMLVYVNGVQRASGALAAPIDTATNNLYMGSSGGSYDWLSARLDEVAVYGSALTAARVQAHYSAANVAPAVSLTQPADASTVVDAFPVFGGAAGVAFGDSSTVTVKVYSGSSASGTPVLTQTAASSNGTWSVSAASALASGTYTARAQQSNATGIVGLSLPSTFQVVAPSSTYRSEVIADAPRAYWRLGEASGTTAASVTSTDTATYVNGVMLGRPGVLTGDPNASVSLDGVNDFVRAPSSANLGPTAALTLETWIKPPSLPSVNATIVRKDLQYLLRLTATGAVTLRLWKGGAITELSTAADAVKAGAWNHVVATWNGSTMLIYVNGAQRASGVLAGPIDSAGDGLYLGASFGTYDWLNSGLDEVAIYAAALSSARVQAHYAAAAVPPALADVRLLTPTSASTMDATPNFGGSASTALGDAATVAIKIYSGSTATGSVLQTLSATVQPAGTFSVKTSSALPSGVYTARAEQANSAAALGYSAARTFTVDAEAPPVMLAAGDIAACDTFGDEATAALLDGLAGTVVSDGDHTYEYNTASDFTNCYDPTWGRHKARTRPVLGDHEYFQPGASTYFDYFGAAAGDRTIGGYYSYDIGAWHVVAMNTNCANVPGGCAAGSPEERWLRADLAAHPGGCTLVYMHVPRFSSGSIHGNDPEMSDFWQALYDHGAELVVAGSEHVYERFAPQTPGAVADPATGIREFIAGTGGRSHYQFGTVKPNSQVRNNTAFGVLKLTLRAGFYDWQFVAEAGSTFTDSGTGSCH